LLELRPRIEVFALAANVNQSVDRTRTSEHLAARREDAAAV
jgi:hypothetical protein